VVEILVLDDAAEPLGVGVVQGLIRKGKTSQEISEKPYISLMTVETHRKNMCTKLDLTGKNELLRFAVEHDL